MPYIGSLFTYRQVFIKHFVSETKSQFFSSTIITCVQQLTRKSCKRHWLHFIIIDGTFRNAKFVHVS
jgi:hypothetical protein